MLNVPTITLIFIHFYITNPLYFNLVTIWVNLILDIALSLNKKNASEADDDGDEDESVEMPVPSYKEFKASLEVAQRYLEAQPNTEKLLNSICEIDNETSIKIVKQKKITEFFFK